MGLCNTEDWRWAALITTTNPGIEIAGIACAVPTKQTEIHAFDAVFGEDSVSKFGSMTGVKAFHVCEERQTASDLAFVSAERLLDTHLHVAREDIGALIFVSQTPDYQLPATACVLASRLRLGRNCLAFDINLGCSGYVYGLQVIAALMSSSSIRYALLLAGDTLSKRISPEDRSACMLFGDAGSATLLVKNPDAPLMNGAFRSDGNGYQTIIIPSGAARNPNGATARTLWSRDGNIRSDYDLFMNGTDVFSFTISDVPKLLKEYMSHAETCIEDYNALVLHQANEFILRQVAKKVKCPVEKLPVSIDRYGNTSVASIPLTLCDLYGNDESGDRIRALLCGFGVGLSWGVMDVTLNALSIERIIESDAYYTEGRVKHD